ncbi:hypothetical protein pb186bvf_008739 [Paramecium bursaria]
MKQNTLINPLQCKIIKILCQYHKKIVFILIDKYQSKQTIFVQSQNFFIFLLQYSNCMIRKLLDLGWGQWTCQYFRTSKIVIGL